MALFLIPLLYSLAGALAIGGAVGGKYVFDVAQREAARDLTRRDREALAEMLRGEIELSELRRQATAAGLDPDTVEEGYRALRDGRVTVDQLIKMLQLTGD